MGSNFGAPADLGKDLHPDPNILQTVQDIAILIGEAS